MITGDHHAQIPSHSRTGAHPDRGEVPLTIVAAVVWLAVFLLIHLFGAVIPWTAKYLREERKNRR